MPHHFKLILEIPTSDLLGEGILWDDLSGEFLWTDILKQRLHRYHLATGSLTTLTLHERLCSFGLTHVKGKLIAAFDQEIGWLDSHTGKFLPVKSPTLPPGVRLNDGRTGPDGAFWVGSMVENSELAQNRDLGCLFRFGPDGRLTRHIEGARICNGLCWSPDGQILYHADSDRACVWAYPFDQVTGELGPGNLHIGSFPAGSPDGAVTDIKGRYLSALWTGGAIGIFSPAGTLEQRVMVPAAQVTCPTFGGEYLNLLAVTSATAGLSPDRYSGKAASAGVFIFQTSLKGTPERRFAGIVPSY